MIRIPGYTEEEKLHIAQRFLVPRQMEEHAITDKHLRLSDGTVRRIVREYTHEAGVRNLEREIANIARKVPRRLSEGQTAKWSPKPADLDAILGPPRFDFGLAETEDQVGAVTGVAVSEYGGDVMTVEAIVVPGKGDFTLTGQLGKVMEESARAAWSYARAHAASYDVARNRIEDNSVHIHVPAGAIPKDGPEEQEGPGGRPAGSPFRDQGGPGGSRRGGAGRGSDAATRPGGSGHDLGLSLPRASRSGPAGGTATCTAVPPACHNRQIPIARPKSQRDNAGSFISALI